MAEYIQRYTADGVEKKELHYKGEVFAFSMIPNEHGKTGDSKGFDFLVSEKFPNEDADVLERLEDLCWADETEIAETLTILESFERKSELKRWHVYQMNDCDLVAATSEEAAKEFYEEFVDREEIDEHFEGEADLSKELRVFTADLSDADRRRVTQVLGEDVLQEEEFRCSIVKWLEIELIAGDDKPFIIASTEY